MPTRPEPQPPRPPIDTGKIRREVEHLSSSEARLIEQLCDEIDRLRAALLYITRPSMGWDGHTDPETFARENTTYLNARMALATCIRMATEALYAPY